METGLFDIQAKYSYEHQQNRHFSPMSPPIIDAGRERVNSNGYDSLPAQARPGIRPERPNIDFARCFLRLANLPDFALDRLSRYEATLWHQARQILLTLDALDRRKPQERVRHFRHREDAGPQT